MKTNFEEVIALLEQAKMQNKLCILALHGVDGSGWADGSISSNLFENICKYLKDNNFNVNTLSYHALYEYLFANTSLNYHIFDNKVILKPILNIDRWPKNYKKIITLKITNKILNKEYIINFDFDYNDHIEINANDELSIK